ncbi:hypothetical protein H9P43_001842 [Blastocladiella emersonii ATCC 22665]|nr:hypothetical protein H9P43_001842 [Blastocladiella emersonii ATCC 22665]
MHPSPPGLPGLGLAPIGYTLGWYALSIALSVYNKTLFGKNGLHFPFPLLTTCLHATLHFAFSAAVLVAAGKLELPWRRVSGSGVRVTFIPLVEDGVAAVASSSSSGSRRNKEHQDALLLADKPEGGSSSSRHHHHAIAVRTDDDQGGTDTPPASPRPSLRRVLIRVIPCGMATALDIGLSNASLKTLSLSFYTMVKSSVPFFGLVFALALGLERLSVRLVVVMISISLGMCLMVAHAHESAFEWVGFAQVMAASVLGGLRMILIQVLLQRSELRLDNPFMTNLYLAPFMFLTLLPMAAAIEPIGSMGTTDFFNSSSATAHTLGLIVLGGTLAFSMIVTEYRAIQLTSGLTISVAGTAKEVLTILIGVLFLGDALTPMNVVGMVICLGAIAYFNYYKYQAVARAAATADYAPTEMDAVTGPSLSSHFVIGDDEDTDEDTDDDDDEDMTQVLFDAAESPHHDDEAGAAAGHPGSHLRHRSPSPDFRTKHAHLLDRSRSSADAAGPAAAAAFATGDDARLLFLADSASEGGSDDEEAS